MIRIAVCDDDPLELKNIKALISDYLRERPQLKISISYFQSPADLLEQIRKSSYHIYLLDIIMNGKNGIQIGEVIRKSDTKASIIYLTVSPDYAVASYTVDAYYYLLKPLEEEKFLPVLERAIGIYKEEEEESQIIRTRMGDVTIRSSQIIYVEYHNHILTYHLTTGACLDSRSFRTSFDEEAKSLLASRWFVKISSAFLVNLRCIKDVTNKGFIMSDGVELTITRSYLDARRDYMEYLLKGVRSHDI